MNAKNIFLIVTIATFLFPFNIFSQDVTIGIKEQLGETIPLDIELTNEKGKKVTLQEFFDKPVILALVYYRCPGICTPLLNELQTVLDRINLEPNKDFRVLTISFDPNETSETASEKRENYVKLMKRQNFPLEAWSFLVGDAENIKRITEAVGFRYGLDQTGKEYRHAGALTILSPEGKIVRYLFGLSYLALDLQMAVIEASEGRVGTIRANVLKYCYSYDSENKKYSLNIVKISGLVIIFLLAIFVSFLLFGQKAKTSKSRNQ